MLLPVEFCRLVSHWHGSTVTPVQWKPSPTRYPEQWFILDVMRTRATTVGLRKSLSRLVSPARCCCKAFGLPPICPHSPSSMSLSSCGSRRLSKLSQRMTLALTHFVHSLGRLLCELTCGNCRGRSNIVTLAVREVSHSSLP